MLNRKLNIRLRHSLNSHCIPSIIINNTVRSFQRSVMNTRALFSPAVHCGIILPPPPATGLSKRLVSRPWRKMVRALVMLKNGTIGITGLMQGCPNGVQTLRAAVSVLTVTWSPHPKNVISRRDSGLLRWKSDRRRKWSKSRSSIAERDVSVLQAFGVRMEFTRGDMLKVCPKFVTSLAGFSRKQTTTINKDSVLQAARQAYARNMTRKTTETADFGSYEVKGNKVEFEVFNPEDRAYDKATVTVGADGNATGASVEFIENSRYVGLPPCFIARRPFLTRTGGCRHNSLPQCAYWRWPGNAFPAGYPQCRRAATLAVLEFWTWCRKTAKFVSRQWGNSQAINVFISSIRPRLLRETRPFRLYR